MHRMTILVLAVLICRGALVQGADQPEWLSRTELLEISQRRSKAMGIAEARREAKASQDEVLKKLVGAGLSEDAAKQQVAKMVAAAEKEFAKIAGDSPYQLGDAADLKFVFQLLYLAQNDDDPQEAARIVTRMFPDTAAVDSALRPEAPADAKKALLAMYDEVRPKADDRDGWNKLMRAPSERHEIRVHAATTEEMAANKGIVSEEFPGGAVEMARTLLRKGLTFYEVEMVEPGESSGTKFHLFFWDGKQWKMLGPAWRAL